MAPKAKAATEEEKTTTDASPSLTSDAPASEVADAAPKPKKKKVKGTVEPTTTVTDAPDASVPIAVPVVSIAPSETGPETSENGNPAAPKVKKTKKVTKAGNKDSGDGATDAASNEFAHPSASDFQSVRQTPTPRLPPAVAVASDNNHPSPKTPPPPPAPTKEQLEQRQKLSRLREVLEIFELDAKAGMQVWTTQQQHHASVHHSRGNDSRQRGLDSSSHSRSAHAGGGGGDADRLQKLLRRHQFGGQDRGDDNSSAGLTGGATAGEGGTLGSDAGVAQGGNWERHSAMGRRGSSYPYSALMQAEECSGVPLRSIEFSTTSLDEQLRAVKDRIRDMTRQMSKWNTMRTHSSSVGIVQGAALMGNGSGLLSTAPMGQGKSGVGGKGSSGGAGPSGLSFAASDPLVFRTAVNERKERHRLMESAMIQKVFTLQAEKEEAEEKLQLQTRKLELLQKQAEAMGLNAGGGERGTLRSSHPKRDELLQNGAGEGEEENTPVGDAIRRQAQLKTAADLQAGIRVMKQHIKDLTQSEQSREPNRQREVSRLDKQLLFLQGQLQDMKNEALEATSRVNATGTTTDHSPPSALVPTARGPSPARSSSGGSPDPDPSVGGDASPRATSPLNTSWGSSSASNNNKLDPRYVELKQQRLQHHHEKKQLKAREQCEGDELQDRESVEDIYWSSWKLLLSNEDIDRIRTERRIIAATIAEKKKEVEGREAEDNAKRVMMAQQLVQQRRLAAAEELEKSRAAAQAKGRGRISPIKNHNSISTTTTTTVSKQSNAGGGSGKKKATVAPAVKFEHDLRAIVDPTATSTERPPVNNYEPTHTVAVASPAPVTEPPAAVTTTEPVEPTAAPIPLVTPAVSPQLPTPAPPVASEASVQENVTVESDAGTLSALETSPDAVYATELPDGVDTTPPEAEVASA